MYILFSFAEDELARLASVPTGRARGWTTRDPASKGSSAGLASEIWRCLVAGEPNEILGKPSGYEEHGQRGIRLRLSNIPNTRAFHLKCSTLWTLKRLSGDQLNNNVPRACETRRLETQRRGEAVDEKLPHAGKLRAEGRPPLIST